MNKGIIMEVHNRYLILLTSEGEFVKGKKQDGVHVGEEIVFHHFREPLYTQLSNVMTILPKPVLMMVASIVFVFAILYPTFNQKSVYAYVSMETNIFVEFEVDEHLHVIDINTKDVDTRNLIAQLDWKGKDVSEVITSILEKSEIVGLINSADNILVTSVLVKNNSTHDDVLSEIEEVRSSHENIEYVEGTIEERTMAQEQGVSTGEYLKTQLESSEPNIETNQHENNGDKTLDSSFQDIKVTASNDLLKISSAQEDIDISKDKDMGGISIEMPESSLSTSSNKETEQSTQRELSKVEREEKKEQKKQEREEKKEQKKQEREEKKEQKKQEREEKKEQKKQERAEKKEQKKHEREEKKEQKKQERSEKKEQKKQERED
ncbi:anti-sigma factor domain-containing protein [Bacillus coahuilensis]|uniref:anti-sigma factor domain-containing protein n=1 Tax=Bacillus coahuilensis TaxID=408580 RepID=UPI000751313F|nr:anti-sigma factor domain-containing protein [Bacillus coahuilensis]